MIDKKKDNSKKLTGITPSPCPPKQQQQNNNYSADFCTASFKAKNKERMKGKK
jgi:hypothetical protein